MQVFHRLNTVGVCLSHSKTVKLIRKLGENHDDVVKGWKHALEVLRSRTDEHQELPVETATDSEYDTQSDSDTDEAQQLSEMSTTGQQLNTCMCFHHYNYR